MAPRWLFWCWCCLHSWWLVVGGCCRAAAGWFLSVCCWWLLLLILAFWGGVPVIVSACLWGLFSASFGFWVGFLLSCSILPFLIWCLIPGSLGPHGWVLSCWFWLYILCELLSCWWMVVAVVFCVWLCAGGGFTCFFLFWLWFWVHWDVCQVIVIEKIYTFPLSCTVLSLGVEAASRGSLRVLNDSNLNALQYNTLFSFTLFPCL